MKKKFGALKSYIAIMLCISLMPAVALAEEIAVNAALVSDVAVVADAIAPAESVYDEAAKKLVEHLPNEIPLSANNDVFILSSWDIDRRGGTVTNQRQNFVSMLDTSEEHSIIIERDIDKQTSGVVTAETGFNFSDSTDGFSYLFSGDGKRVIEFVTEKGYLCYTSESGNVPFFRIVEEEVMNLKAIIDLDNRTADLSVNGEFLTTAKLDGDYTSFDHISFTTPKYDVMNVHFKQVRIYKNYLINERFITPDEGSIPYDWTLESNAGNTAYVAKDSFYIDYKGLLFNDDSIVDRAVVTKKFEKTSDKFAFTMNYIFPERKDGITFALNDGDKPVITMQTSGDSMVYNDGVLSHTYSENVWQTSRIEVDLKKKEALIKHNGKDVDVIKLNTNSVIVDSFVTSTSVNGKCEFFIDDVFATPIIEYDDYPAEPVIPEGDDYYVGMMKCSLWEEGLSYGWDNITPHEDRHSYLGFYDEGKSEVSDWELKWMAEHGVDFQAWCWYMPEAYKGGPLKGYISTTEDALHEGYFNSKYSKYVDFALLVCGVPKNTTVPTVWRENIVPYWIDYYFKDERYFTIDNKPVIYFFSWTNWIDAFGGESGAKVELEYLENELRKIGYDGAILIGNSSAAGSQQILLDSGFDAGFVYTWGSGSYNPKTQTQNMDKQYNEGILPFTAVVSQGYSKEAWHKGTEAPFATPDTFEEVLTWVRDEYMPRFKSDHISSKLVTLANWNEYGEGHFIMPSNLYGFGYLDAVRNVFTDGGEHTDARPTDNQLSRLRGLHPENRRLVRYVRNNENVYPTKVVKGWYFNNPDHVNDWKIEKQVDKLDVVDGKLHGTSTGVDGGIVMKAPYSLPLRDISYIKIRMKSTSRDGRSEIFFTTDSDTTFTAKKSSNCVIVDTGEFNDYYFRFDNNELWTGNLDKIRFDMSNKNNDEFFIESIEILENDVKKTTFTLDNKELKLDFNAENRDGTMLIPFNPVGGWFEKFGATARWSHPEQTLNIYTDDVNMLFTIGSKTALINGAECELPYEVYMKDGLPMVPARFLVEKLGGTITYDGEARNVNIATPVVEEVVKDTTPVVRVPYEYEFSVNGDTEGLVFSNSFSRKTVKNGVLTLKSTSNDPMFYMNNISMDTNKYRYVKVRIKNTTTSSNFQVFFASDETGPHSQTNMVSLTIKKEDNEFREYEIDMLENPNWKGNITSLRIDPISTKGTVEIDYIRVTE